MKQNEFDKIERFSYMRNFSDEELSEMKENLSKNMIQYSDLQNELSEIKESFKNQMKPLIERQKVLVVNLKNKAEAVSQDCGVEFDRTTGIALIYDVETGEQVGRRPMTIEEKEQLTISYKKTGTNN